MPLAAHGPRSKVIERAESRCSQYHAVNGCFENFTVASAQNGQWMVRIARHERLFAHEP
jgi:hypothetical protein